MKKSRNRVDFIEENHKIWYNYFEYCVVSTIVGVESEDAGNDFTENHVR